MKAILSRFFLLPIFIMAIVSCAKDEEPVKVSQIRLSKTALELKTGASEKLEAFIIPDNAEYEGIEWSSSDSGVASVDPEGNVTAVSSGNAVITASVDGVKGECNVTVLPPDASEVKLDKTEMSIVRGQTGQLTATVLPEDAVDKTVKWTSSNKNIVTVSSDGLVTAVSVGSAVVKASCGDATAECKVSVTPILPESVKLDAESLDMAVGDITTLKITVEPEDVDAYTVNWSSSDESVATVTEGVVRATGAGSAVIEAKIGELSATCSVNVLEKEDGAKLGDYYYSDGTYSSEIIPDKEVIGIVFWTGNPTLHDASLKREHPECTHGLVMALNGCGAQRWYNKDEYAAYKEAYPDYYGYVSMWIEEYVTEYETNFSKRGLTDNINKVVGYNNTKALEKFNDAPENSAWPLNIVKVLRDFRDTVAAPASSSGWYIPSPKEWSIFTIGDYEGNISDINFGSNLVDNLYVLNDILKNTPGATEVPVDVHWTSSETTNIWQETQRIVATGAVPIGALGSEPADRIKEIRMVLAF